MALTAAAEGHALKGPVDFAARHSDLVSVSVTSPGGAHIESALKTLPDHVAALKAAPPPTAAG